MKEHDNQLIAGLIQTLPPYGSEWGIDDRRRWLQVAAAIFGLIYKNAENDCFVVTVKVEDIATVCSSGVLESQDR